MSSIMRWRNGLMGLSVMAITPVSHEVSEPHDLETGRAILLIPTSNPPRARSRWGVYLDRQPAFRRGAFAGIASASGARLGEGPVDQSLTSQGYHPMPRPVQHIVPSRG